MNSRFLDILSLVAAVIVVVIIAVLMNNPPAGDELKVNTSVDVTDSPAVIVSENISLQKDFLTKEDQKWIIASRISKAMDYYEPDVRDFAARLIPKEHGGEYSIRQVSDIWDGVKEDWTYKADKGSIMDVSPASRTVHLGLGGDSNDFAVFMASMIKAVGGQARIKTVPRDDGSCHVYAEISLGSSADLDKKIINSSALSELKSSYSFAFANDPMGLNVFKYKSGEICTGESCWQYVEPFSMILNDPVKYSDICYENPKLIEYLLLAPYTNEIEFQAMYLKLRYGSYRKDSTRASVLRDIEYNYDYEDNGDKTYWLPLDWFGSYPGDGSNNAGGAFSVYYSDGSWNDQRFAGIGL
ncbi:hypothetical protein F1737_01660 [Methanoplanus sp. FWC-SCC4]|uniref:Uncharacterized protein n=1 Tax=Methanochimaera problematica TaxID=2609417 RepID=A0AA97FAS8_9EURY|nr:hypothetical protein [Methanoplanus sp. FWC-SCC4]WOF15477.1 hypothetical protein F1737_01660 [Methanoplanus sp. FWC-SCC4]